MCTPWPISDRPQMTVTCAVRCDAQEGVRCKAGGCAWGGCRSLGEARRQGQREADDERAGAAAEPLRKSRRVVDALVLMAVSVPQAPSVAAASLMAARIRL